MAYIEEDTFWDRVCKLERQLEIQHLEDQVSTLEDIIETDGEKLDRLSERVEQKPQVQQTTEEFVKVVRCKDCKNYHKLGADFGGCDEWGEIYIKEDDYCSRGIR